jgi:di/tricarboxylate transporter
MRHSDIFAAPISIVVILVALLIAYYITKPDSVIWFCIRPRKTEDEEKLHES